jgi:hypothetical protein
MLLANGFGKNGDHMTTPDDLKQGADGVGL